jgi:two-component system response regulator (stage 0 sporulation protein F)
MKTLLLIDHDINDLVQHGDILGRAGYRVMSARDGRSSLFVLESGLLPDLIVTEYTMPDMEPGEILAQLRKHAPSVPVVVLTSCNSVESYVHAISLGAHDYANKPLLVQELRGIVAAATGAGRADDLPAA